MKQPEIDHLTRQRDAVLQEAATLRQQLTQLRKGGHRKSELDRLEQQIKAKEQTASTLLAQIKQQSQPRLF